MHTPSYLSARCVRSENITTYTFFTNRGVMTLFMWVFLVIIAIGAYMTFAGSENTAYMIFAIVSAIIVVVILFKRGFSVGITIDFGKRVLGITKRFFHFQYMNEQLLLGNIEGMQCQKTINLCELCAFDSSLAILSRNGRVGLFRGDSELNFFGKELAAELHIPFFKSELNFFGKELAP